MEKYTIDEIYLVFKEYKESQGKEATMEIFKTTYLYKGLVNKSVENTNEKPNNGHIYDDGAFLG